MLIAFYDAGGVCSQGKNDMGNSKSGLGSRHWYPTVGGSQTPSQYGLSIPRLPVSNGKVLKWNGARKDPDVGALNDKMDSWALISVRARCYAKAGTYVAQGMNTVIGKQCPVHVPEHDFHATAHILFAEGSETS